MTDDTQTVIFKRPVTSVDEVQQGWIELKQRLERVEAEHSGLEKENKALRLLLERAIEHRQKSHGELVLLLAGLVSKLPINDIGVIVSRLMDHNTSVSEVCAALTKGTVLAGLPQPAVLKTLEQSKRDLKAALKTAVEKLIQTDPPLEVGTLRALVGDPELFFSPAVVRANRCYVKGQLPRERIVREFGQEALMFFNDLTTDPKLNPRPKAEEIVLVFKNDFEALFQQNPGVTSEKRQELLALYQRVQRSKAATEAAHAQRNAFQELSFILELLHYYENQNTEAPEVPFAQRLPVLIEQLVVASGQEKLEEKLIVHAEELLAYVIQPDHRLMIVNNVGKSGGLAKTLKFVLKLRAERVLEQDHVIAEFVKDLIPPQKPPRPGDLTPTLRLIHPENQRLVVKAIMHSERIRKEEAETLGRALGKELGFGGLEEELKAAPALSPELQRQIAWENIKELISRRADPAAVATAIRDRLHVRYDADELKQSWITLIEAEPILLIRTVCQLPYLADGRTDPIARPVVETYISRLMHEKYVATYTKVLNSLKNMFKAKPDSPTLLNFIALVRWVDAEAANRLSRDIGMPAAAH
jgi:hypothetical protein